jgi:aldose 1-epimerase
VKKEFFGTLPDGTVVEQFTLTNANGLGCRLLDYGVTIASLQVPDAKGRVADVVLGFDDLAGYLTNTFFGPVCGRVANRIGGARFVLDGKTYPLSANEGQNQLHGGHRGFDKVVWKTECKSDQCVEFFYASRDGEEGYPGNLETKVTVTLGDQNELRLDYVAQTDKPTAVNLTSHSYFNLAGGGLVLDHELMLAADHYTPADEDLVPTGEIKPVKGSAMDFTTSTAIGAQLKRFPAQAGYDANFVINGGGKKLTRAARVIEPASGRVMETWTTQPGVQFYTANHFNGIRGRRGARYERFGGFCLETQHFPDSVNKPRFPSIILRPGDLYRHTCIYRFSSL